MRDENEPDETGGPAVQETRASDEKAPPETPESVTLAAGDTEDEIGEGETNEQEAPDESAPLSAEPEEPEPDLEPEPEDEDMRETEDKEPEAEDERVKPVIIPRRSDPGGAMRARMVPVREDDPKKERRRRGGGRFFQAVAWLFASAAIVLIVAIAALAVFLIQLSDELPSSRAMQNYEPPITTRIYSGDGSLLAEFARERRLFVPISDIPPQIVQAFLAAEDKNFYQHSGIDLRGIARAALANIDNFRNNRRLEGASTITQQVARNFLLTSEVSFDRKIKEALIALRIERTFSKEYILELYLNQIYLGWRSYGIASAALNYFDKSLEELTLAEMAYLAALPKAPNNYHPTNKKEAAVTRRNWVLDRMEVNGFISAEQVREAKLEDLVTHERPVGAQFVEAEYYAEEVRRQLYEMYDEKGLYEGGLSVRTTLDTRMQKWARDSLRFGLVEYDQRHGWRGAYGHIDDVSPENWLDALNAVDAPGDLDEWRLAVVLSASASEAKLGFKDASEGRLPLSNMTWARPWIKGEQVGAVPSSVRSVLKKGDVVFVEEVSSAPVEAEGIASISEGYALRQIPEVNGAIVVMDPHTGRVFSMVGGFSFEGSEFNRATQAYRQPGSSFKPIVYSAALDHGFTPSSIILDGPLVVDQGPGLPLWKPKNYSDKFYGESTLRTGIEQSRNLMTARLALDMGMAPIADYARRFGVVENLEQQPAMALGAAETTLYKMLAAYSIFVNGGKKVTPTLIDRIQDRYGKTILIHDQRVCKDCLVDEWNNQPEPQLADVREEVLDPRTAYQIVSIMEGAVLRGTGRRMRTIGKPLAGKTGTTNDSRDAWFISSTPDLIAGAYVGFDQPRSLGPRETGGRVALPIVKKFFESALKDVPGIPFRIPNGIRLVRVNAKTGLLAARGDRNVILEAFKPGTEPTSSQASTRITIGADGLPVQLPQSSNDLSSGTGGLY